MKYKEELIERINYFLANNKGMKLIHGSQNYFLENIAFNIGIYANYLNIEKDKVFENSINSIFVYILNLFNDENIVKSDFDMIVLSNCILFMYPILSKIGINEIDINKVENYFLERLQRIISFLCCKRIYYTNDEKEKLKGIPKCWIDKKVVKQENTNPYFLIPLIYDLLGFFYMYNHVSNDIQVMMNEVIEYIMSSDYQDNVVPGYGIGIGYKDNKKKYFSVGWDILLKNLKPSQELTYMLLLSKYPSSRNTKWFIDNYSKYHKFMKERGCLSKEYFTYRKTYWVFGYLNFGFLKNDLITNSEYIINRLDVNYIHIETQRTVIRNYVKQDYLDLFEILSDEETMKYIEPVNTLEETISFLNDFCINRNGAFACINKSNNKAIGYILFNKIEKYTYEIGWIFNRNYLRQGYAYESCSKLIDYVFNKLVLDRITCSTIDTVKSLGLMKKLGFTEKCVERNLVTDNEGKIYDYYTYELSRI